MNYLAAFLLSITNETRAFVLLDIVMRDYGYRWMYVHGLPHLCLCLWQLDHLLAMNLPVRCLFQIPCRYTIRVLSLAPY